MHRDQPSREMIWRDPPSRDMMHRDQPSRDMIWRDPPSRERMAREMPSREMMHRDLPSRQRMAREMPKRGHRDMPSRDLPSRERDMPSRDLPSRDLSTQDPPTREEGEDGEDEMVSATASAWARAVRKGSMKVSPWVSRLALADMQALSGEGCWGLQVAPQGRGQDLWPPELSARGISIVRGRTKAEGLYIQLAPDSGLPLPELTEALDEAATGIRLRTRCCET